MKNLNLFRKSARGSEGSTLASAVVRPSFDRRSTVVKHLAFMLLFLLGSLNVWGTEEVYKTALFGSSYNSKKVSGYTNVSFSSTNGDFTVNVANANNNNNGWAFIKIGGKNGAYTGTITTSAAIDKAITKVALTIDAITASNVTSITLKTSTDGSSWVDAGTFDKSTGAKQVTITSPMENLYYQIEAVCTKGSSNGLLTISKVEFYAEKEETSDPTVFADPEEVTDVVAEGVENQTISLTYENIENYVTEVSVHPNADGTGSLSPAWLSASVSDADDYATVTYSVTANDDAARTAYIKVYTTGGDKEATTIIPVSQVKYVAPFTGSILEITKDNFLSGGYAKNDAGITVSGFDFAVKDVYQNSSTIQAKASSGYIYSKSVFGEIAKIEITKNGQGNNNFTVYQGTEEHPQTNSVTGEIDGTTTTYTFSSGMTYFTLKNGGTYSTVNPIKIYYYPVKSKVTIDDAIENGSVNVTGAADLTSVSVGTELTLSNTPVSGYKFGSYTVYKTGDTETTITVTNNKFIMPAFDVTVSFSASCRTKLVRRFT